jgi:hypothetical protein
MATSRSYYLSSRLGDFTEPEADAGGVDIIDIPYVMPDRHPIHASERQLEE